MDDTTSPLTCFIVGPIGDRLAPIGTPGRLRWEDATQMWEQVFEPACKEFKLTPIRADKIAESGEITEQIFGYLRDSDVVIADLSGGNANVMYELGLRHTRNKITLQIGEYERLPFDITTIRTIQFRRTDAGLIDARKSLIETVRVALEGGGTPVTATRLWSELVPLNSETIAAAAARSAEEDDPLDAEDDDAGPQLMDQLATGEAATIRVSALLEEFSETVALLGSLTEEAAPGLESATSFAAKLTASRRLVEQFGEPAGRLDILSDEYLLRVGEIDLMVRLIVGRVEAGDEPLGEEIRDYLTGVVSLSRVAKDANVGMTIMIHGVRDMRKWSQLFRTVSKSLERSINRILRGNTVVASWRDLVADLPMWPDEEPDNGDGESSTNE